MPGTRTEKWSSIFLDIFAAFSTIDWTTRLRWVLWALNCIGLFLSKHTPKVMLKDHCLAPKDFTLSLLLLNIYMKPLGAHSKLWSQVPTICWWVPALLLLVAYYYILSLVIQLDMSYVQWSFYCYPSFHNTIPKIASNI